MFSSASRTLVADGENLKTGLLSNPHRTHDRFAIRAPRRLLRARVLRCALVHGGLSAPSGWCGSIARGEARGVAAASLVRVRTHDRQLPGVEGRCAGRAQGTERAAYGREHA